MIVHVRFTCAANYNERRLPFRPAHLAQLAGLREQRRVVAGGPEPDGRAANIFYRVADLAELDAILAENVFYRAELFVGHHARAFTEFLEPLELPPLDAALETTIVEGAVTDRAAARDAITKLRGDRLVAFGGFFEDDGSALAVVRANRAEDAVAALARAGGFTALAGRAWSQTL